MPGELMLVASSSGLTVDSDLYREGSLYSTVRLAAAGGAGGTTLYKGNMPANTPRGKYMAVYRVTGSSDIQGPDFIHWGGAAEVDLALLQAQILEIRGNGFITDTDSLEAISNAIFASGGSGGGGSTTPGSFTTIDRAALGRIELAAAAAAAAAIGDFLIDRALKTGTLLDKDGTQVAKFQLRDMDGQPSIERAVQRIRIEG